MSTAVRSQADPIAQEKGGVAVAKHPPEQLFGNPKFVTRESRFSLHERPFAASTELELQSVESVLSSLPAERRLLSGFGVRACDRVRNGE